MWAADLTVIKYAPVAQLVECNTCNVDVAGSSPVRGSKFKKIKKDGNKMHHELEARTRKALEEKIENLNKNLKDMETDFAKCATGISPCFFCANDEFCQATSDNGCCFVWKSHN